MYRINLLLYKFCDIEGYKEANNQQTTLIKTRKTSYIFPLLSIAIFGEYQHSKRIIIIIIIIITISNCN